MFTVNVFPLAIVKVPVLVLIIKPLILVAVAAPSTGVINVGVLANTNEPVPVSSLITPANSLELVVEKPLNLLDV